MARPPNRATGLPHGARYPSEHYGIPPEGYGPGPVPGDATGGTRQPVPDVRNATSTVYAFKTSASSQQVSPDQHRRSYLAIQNNGASEIYVSFSNKASTRSLKLESGAFYEPYIPPSTSIHILGSSGGGQDVVIIEGLD